MSITHSLVSCNYMIYCAFVVYLFSNEMLINQVQTCCKVGTGARSCPTSQKGRGAAVWDEHGDLRPAVKPQVHGRGISRQRPCPSQAGGGEMTTERLVVRSRSRGRPFGFNFCPTYRRGSRIFCRGGGGSTTAVYCGRLWRPRRRGV